ncbi:MAG: thioredoxin domain-containing protein [Gammaproteobacteria bacterium]|nr:thioredoxin domain-containing protein [Gammaproteobacteria bacterium]
MSDATPQRPPNRLARTASPYLRQHAGNPVDWYPWGEEALELARRSGRPILLSIGYAACHWCHVMAHESFEDPATAALMNELFVNIKVDREERPDLDRIYQIAHQMITGRGGGWPLTMFLMHDDQRPFFGGTYFPGEARHGLPAFRDLLGSVAEHYHRHREALRTPAAALTAALADLNPPPSSLPTLDAEPLRAARAEHERSFDTDWGGFGGAPKFPHPPSIARLLRDWQASARDDVPDLQALYMATLTLTRMAEGGLFDQLGGGFCRYAVDQRWEIPHFEKMLYDNGQLLQVYAEAALATGEELFRTTASRTVDWLLGEMRAPDGAFYSSLDADSEGHEGRYYVWDRAALRTLLDADEYRVAAAHYGLDQPPNFEGAWHLTARRALAAVANGMGIEEPQARARLESARRRMLAERSRRVRPGLDDKILTAWNALAIRGLVAATDVLERPDCLAAAEAALTALRTHHWRNGRLLAARAPGAGALPAYLDDHAVLAAAVLDLQSLRFRVDELRFAVELVELMLAQFEDPAIGGFYFTAADHEQLICRPKVLGDDAQPAGNAVAASVLIRLGYLLGEPRYLAAAERALRAAWAAMLKYPTAHAATLQALEEFLVPPQIVILRGPAALVESWRRQLAAVYAPHRLVLAIPEHTPGLPEALASRRALPGGVAYVCRGSTCSEPLHDVAALARALD